MTRSACFLFTLTALTVSIPFGACKKDPLKIPDIRTITIRSDSTQDVTANFHEGVPVSAESNGDLIPELAIYAWTNGGAYVEGKVYIAFDLSGIPSGAQIRSATLNMFGKSTGEWIPQGNQGENAIRISRILNNWDEKTLTWNNAPPVTNVNQVLTPPATRVWDYDMSVTVTALLQDMIDMDQRYGFCLSVTEPTPYRSIAFSSSEAADTLKRPSLVVTYAR